VLVVGASRGIGLEFVEQLLARGCGRVFATHRGEAVPAGLQDVVERHDAADYKGKIEDALHTLSMDVDVDADVDRAVAELRERLGADGRRLTHVIHSAGVYGPRGTTLLGDSSGSGSGNGSGSGSGDELVQTREELVDVFRTNAAAPFAVAQRVLPLLMEGEQGGAQEGEAGAGGAGGAGRNDGVYAWLSSKVGSIEDNASGGRYAYRASKAALNMIAKVRRARARAGGGGGRVEVVCGGVWGV
jgi:NAD(P)-dependent dehydrogenase (short-subunit alcohol dehydrogenase family)